MRQMNVNMEWAFIKIGKSLKEREPKLYLYFAWYYFQKTLKRTKKYFTEIINALGNCDCHARQKIKHILENIDYLLQEKTFCLPRNFNKTFTEKEMTDFPILCELMVAMLIFYYTKNYVDV